MPMFNLAKKRREGTPRRFRQEESIFKSKPLDQKLQEDALGIARIMVGNGLEEPEDALAKAGEVEYWDYIRELRPRYLEKVLKRAKEMGAALAKDFREHPEKFPFPQKQKGGPGGA